MMGMPSVVPPPGAAAPGNVSTFPGAPSPGLPSAAAQAPRYGGGGGGGRLPPPVGGPGAAPQPASRYPGRPPKRPRAPRGPPPPRDPRGHPRAAHARLLWRRQRRAPHA
jgi:hypothetical protein